MQSRLPPLCVTRGPRSLMRKLARKIEADVYFKSFRRQTLREKFHAAAKREQCASF